MGGSNSKMEDDKALHLCRERKRFVRQALDGRCSLAAAHVSYVQSLKNTGIALRKFTEPEAPVESSLYTSTNATPEPLALTEKTLSQFSFSSPSASQRMETVETFSPSPSPPSSSTLHANHMKYSSSHSKKVEEKLPTPVVGTVTSSSSAQNATAPSARRGPETSEFDAFSVPADSQPWDYFGLFDHQFSFQEGKGIHQDVRNADDITQLREEEGIPELEDDEEKVSSQESEVSQDSEDEFDDEPATDTLVRKFENRANDHVAADVSPSTSKPPTGISVSEVEVANGEKSNSPDLSTLKPTSAVALLPTETNKSTQKENHSENKVAPKDFFSSMKDIEFLFGRASESGKEVPRMLEANKLHFRPIFPGKENGSMASSFLKACFSCGEDPSQVPEEPAQNSVKYLTWHRTASSRSSSSRNPLGANSKNDTEDLTSNLFDNFCMISGSHASTLDRLYAWERKLYDEVKASGIVRREYDMKCKILRQLESTEEKKKVEKTRATVKDLHTRIRVAIHRIDSISKRIEELRDKELQPQLEELIEGLSRMWEVMFECHKLQFQIISAAYNNSHARIAMQSEVRRQITAYLENELHSLSSSFNKWITAQKSYLEAITGWLYKCVSLKQKSSRRKRSIPQPPPLRYYGPPIYATCDDWLDKLNQLPAKDVIDSIKSLAGETARFLPRQEKNQVKGANHPHITSWKADVGSESADNLLRDDTSEDWVSGFDHFRASLLRFLGQLYNFAECSVKMYAEVRQAIQDAKDTYSQWNLQFQGSQRKPHAQDGNVNSQPQDDQSQSQSQVA